MASVSEAMQKLSATVDDLQILLEESQRIQSRSKYLRISVDTSMFDDAIKTTLANLGQAIDKAIADLESLPKANVVETKTVEADESSSSLSDGKRELRVLYPTSFIVRSTANATFEQKEIAISDALDKFYGNKDWRPKKFPNGKTYAGEDGQPGAYLREQLMKAFEDLKAFREEHEEFQKQGVPEDQWEKLSVFAPSNLFKEMNSVIDSDAWEILRARFAQWGLLD